MLTHPAIAEAAAVAVPSAEWGEAVGLALVLRGGFDQPGASKLGELLRREVKAMLQSNLLIRGQYT